MAEHGDVPVRTVSADDPATATHEAAITVTFILPRPLVPYADGRTEIACDSPSDTLRDALDVLAQRYSALVDRILTERGEVRPHVNLFVGDEDIRYLGGLAADVADGATVSILPAVSGG